MAKLVMISQPTSTFMRKETNVVATSVFETSPETHLYGGILVPPCYQSLSDTFFGVSTSLWTYPMSSSYRIPSSTSLMSATQTNPPIVPQTLVE